MSSRAKFDTGLSDPKPNQFEAMVNLTQFTTRLIFLCLLWVLTRSLQFVFQLSRLSHEADCISGSELELQVKIIDMLREAMPERLKAEV